jgi:hypothetical protein
MFIPPPSEYREVSMSRQNFWLAAIVGAIVMFILFFLPVVGPLFGGFVAGLIARGNPKNGAKTGLTAGIIGGVLQAIILLIGFPGLIGVFNRALADMVTGAGLDPIFGALSVCLYYALLGLMGGVIGAALVKN